MDLSVSLSGSVIVEEPTRLFPGCSISNSTFGAFSYVSPGASIHNATVGRYCSIGDGVQVLSQHPRESLTTSPFPYQTIFSTPFDAPPQHDYNHVLSTKIGNDVWIGSGAKLKGGIQIGDGAIIGAGALVSKDVEPFAVVGGVPAKILRLRFSYLQISQIQKLQWWRYNLVGLLVNWRDPGLALSELARQIESDDLKPYVGRKYKIWRHDGNILAQRVADEVSFEPGGINRA